MKDRIVTHWRTSVIGMLAAVLIWWQGTNFHVPTTKQEWAAAVGGVLIAALGLAARNPQRGG